MESSGRHGAARRSRCAAGVSRARTTGAINDERCPTVGRRARGSHQDDDQDREAQLRGHRGRGAGACGVRDLGMRTCVTTLNSPALQGMVAPAGRPLDRKSWRRACAVAGRGARGYNESGATRPSQVRSLSSAVRRVKFHDCTARRPLVRIKGRLLPAAAASDSLGPIGAVASAVPWKSRTGIVSSLATTFPS